METRKRKRLEIHPERCTGCRICEAACTSYHYNSLDYGRSRIRMIRDNDNGLDIVTVCVQCDEKPCVESCPVDAITPNENGTISIADSCTSCGKCKKVCPYSGPNPDPKRERYIVCDLCGGTPQCALWCPFDAIDYKEEHRAEEDKKYRELINTIETNNSRAFSKLR